MSIADIKHPDYGILQYDKWRLTFEGGSRFINRYLTRFSLRETDGEFQERLSKAYVPAFAKSALLEIRNSIYERLGDVTRIGGSKFYQESVNGLDGGVDRTGSKMSDFIGTKVLDDLLVISKIGVFVDRPEDPGATLADVKKPYLYVYKAEDIQSWTTDPSGKYVSLLLKALVDDIDADTGLTKGTVEEFRHYLVQPGGVLVRTYRNDGSLTVQTLLGIPEIPFVLFKISHSLLTDVADYQIAHMNLASSDLNYAIYSNFPFYTEQYSPQSDFAARQTSTGTAEEGGTAGPAKVETGPTRGRRYPKGTERPEFINPSDVPLRVSMDKQETLKSEIRQLLHLAVTNIRPQRQSADSKEKDNQGLEAGLSAIGTALAMGEREIARFWAMYEGTEPATVEYPSQYSLRSEEERLAEAKELTTLLPKVPSLSYQRQLAKRIARLTVGPRISNDELIAIDNEIDAATVISIDPEVIQLDHEAGFVSTETASRARLYPKGEVEQAKKDHAERAARIAMAQSEASARGVADMSAHDKGADDEKEDSQSADTNVKAPTKKVRGK